MLKIATITTAYSRHEITSLCLHNLYLKSQRAEKENNVRIINFLCVTKDNEDYFSCFQWFSRNLLHVIEYNNKPLGKKLNFSVSCALDYNVDYIIKIDSDDLICHDFFPKYIEFMRKGYDYIGLTDFFVYSKERCELKHWKGYEGERKGEMIGSGRCVSKGLLSAMGNKLCEDNLNSALDKSMTKLINKSGFNYKAVSFNTKEVILIDIKEGDNNITKYDVLKGDIIMKNISLQHLLLLIKY